MEQTISMQTQNKRVLAIFGTVAVLLSIPLIAMSFTSEVNWTFLDLVVAGFLLLGTGLAIEFVLRMVRKTSHRIALTLGILFILFIVWAELAVGIIGTPFAGS